MTSKTPNNFIVVFKDHATHQQIDEYCDRVNNTGGQVKHRYKDILKGFSAKMELHHLQSLQGDDIIAYVEPDQEVSIQPISPS
ncbi:hypothetical protein FRB99_004006 [Tulasnella sp. 403]|nr:hypothetical protein FRB99_004006 [Tulasnella sp. 403]